MSDPQLWLAAIEIGCFFALVALSMYLVVVGASFFNFAAGPYAMAAAMVTGYATTAWGLPVVFSALLGVAVGITVSLLTEVIVVRNVQRRSGGAELPALVAVTATLFAIQQLAGTIFGRTPLPVQNLFPFANFSIGGVAVQGTTVTIVLVTVVAAAATIMWLRSTTTGQLLRAVGDNNEAAQIIGVGVNRVRLWAFGISGAIAAIAGIVFAAKSGAQFTNGLSWTLTGFLALVIGGTGKPWAPLVGGLALGIVQVFGSYYFGATGSSIAIFLIALTFFAFRPEGLFQRKVRV
ncbi:branched-chain amino acid ABC transporter permease [Rhodococcus sp. 1163]|uniref:branched-chain amino acid ABC transporter permease n=1 Tax=unclassified Rhodococcus (in: high G+C Gram-positive bacteria) TaxID=192944 RepID=UPI000A025AB1|nr:branched-chain amino acid ABC transporter permease [Rhodococcus sp. 1163]ORI19017.1 branched-chain amino acid ABC transporter permease [Rhodococcus sp. 1163]